MNTTMEPKTNAPADPRTSNPEKAPGSEPKIASQNDLNLIREILLRPTEELNEERIVELVRMIEEQEEAFGKRIQKLEAQVKKLATTVDNNQLHSVADIGNAMISAGQKIMDVQEKLVPTAAITKT